MVRTTDKATSLWLTTDEKQLLRDYRDSVFGDSDVGLRHALRHAIKEAEDDE